MLCSFTLIRELKTGTIISQRSLGRLLGVIDYDSYPACLSQSIDVLLEGVNRTVRMFLVFVRLASSNLEIRQVLSKVT